MTFPTDTNHFDPLPAPPISVVDLNVRLAQLSGAITAAEEAAGGTGIEITANVSMLALDAAYVNPSDGELYPIDADALVSTHYRRGFVQNAVSASGTATLIQRGILDGFVGLTPGLPVYADASGDGTITQTPPAPVLDSGQVAIVPMGMAISATEVDVLPSYMNNTIRYLVRYSPALDETITVQHAANPKGSGRNYKAYVSQAATLTEYGLSNQDSDVAIEGPDGAGSVTNSGAQTGNDLRVGDVAGTDYRVAQSFTLSAAGILSQFTFTLRANSGSPSGDVTWEIRNNNAGDPGTTVLATGSIANGSMVASAVNTVNVSNGPFLAASTTYWIVWIPQAAQSTNVGWNLDANSTGSYANGSVTRSSNGGSSWTALSAFDTTFTVTVTAITHNDKLAQGFQLDEAGNVQAVKLWLKKVGSPTDNLTVEIQPDSATNPSGTPVTNGTSDTVAASSLSTSHGWILFPYSTPPALAAATQYHIVLKTAGSQSNTNYVVWGADGSTPGYANGSMKRERSAAWSAESKDAVFQIVATGIEYINPVMVDWWSSTKADMVAQAGDSGGADRNIKTTFKCKAAAGFADLTVEVTS